MGYEVDYLINNRPAKKFGHEGRTFIEARAGTEYTIRIRNNTPTRVEAVTTVDGLSVVDGQLGTKESRGYIIPAYGSYEIKGFRTSNENVNAFRFNEKQKSYAANSEAANFSDQHCGVIAVVVYVEKAKPQPDPGWNIRPQPFDPQPWRPPYPYPWRPNRPWRTPVDPYDSPYWRGGDIICKSTGDTSGDSSQFQMRSMCQNSRGISVNHMADLSAGATYPAAAAPSATVMSFDLGTEFSNKVVVDKVTEVPFERGLEGPTMTVYYASRAVLESFGVPLDKVPAVATSFPDPFPKDSGRYCKPPTKKA